jgi:hypothetical protein
MGEKCWLCEDLGGIVPLPADDGKPMWIAHEYPCAKFPCLAVPCPVKHQAPASKPVPILPGQIPLPFDS